MGLTELLLASLLTMASLMVLVLGMGCVSELIQHSRRARRPPD